MLVRRLVLSCTSALLAVSVLTPAHAERVETPDAVGDVTVVGGGTAPEGSASGSADIVTLSLKHTRSINVNLTIRVRDLRFSPAPSARPTARGYLRTAGGAVYRVTGMPGMSRRGYRLDRLREGREPQQVPCSITGRQSAAEDTFAFAFARSCLRNPRWLQSGAATSDARTGQELVDDARRTGSFQGGDAVRIGGPRVHPGSTSATATP